MLHWFTCYRGGDLINFHLLQRVKQRKFLEQQVLLKIKSKMQGFKKKQEHTREKSVFISTDHYKGRTLHIFSFDIFHYRWVVFVTSSFVHPVRNSVSSNLYFLF